MTNFEAITKNPETLAAFLRALPILEGPWDEEFQRNYCAGCGKVSCDDGSPCPYEDKRNSPGWWLGREAKKGGTMMKYSVIITWYSGETTGAVINADGPKAAWEKLFELFDFRHIRGAQLAEILTVERGAAK